MNFYISANILLRNLLIIGFILCLVPFFSLAFFNYPAGFDDFQNAIKVFEYGEWGYIGYVYNNWAGRFSSNALLAFLNPLKYNEWLIGFKLLPIFVFTAFVLSVAYFLKALSWKELDNRQIIIGSIGLLVIYLFAIPSVAELFYWFTGACVYTAGIIFFLILLGSVINYLNATKVKSKTIYAIVALSALVTVIGINEPILFAVLFLSFVALVAAFLLKTSNRSFFLFLFLLACVIALFSITAPGNAVRGSMLHGDESMYSFSKLASAMAKSLYFSSVKFMSWANSLVLILVSILIVPTAIKIIDNNWWLRKVTSIHPFLSLVLTIIFLAVQVFTAFLGTGDAEPRIWSSVYFFFLMSWFYNVLVFSNFFRGYFKPIYFKKLFFLQPLVLLLLVFSADSSINKAFLDLAFKAPKYSASLKNRYQLIESSPQQHLLVPPLFDRDYKYPKTIFVKEVGINPDDKNNISLSKYFNLKSISLKNEALK